MESTLMVSDHPAPEVKGNITTSLLNAGKLSGPDAVVLYPSTNFTIHFDDGLFSSATSDLTQYTTILSNRSPLPSWVKFDSGSLAFSGTSPAADTLPQTLEILLIASDYPGFAGAEVGFSIFVSNHEFVFAVVEQTISLSPGDSVRITNLRGSLSLDGNPVNDSNLRRTTAQVPEWLFFDPRSMEINGAAPQNISYTEITVLAVDTYGDVANTTLQLISASMLLRGDIGVLNAVVGEPVKFDMSTVIVGGSDLDIQVDLGAAAQWLQFDQTERAIIGEIPAGTKPQTIHASVNITKAEGSVSDSQGFSIVIESANATATPSDHSSSATRSSSDPESSSVIIAVSVCCVLFALIALVLGILFFRRRKRASSRGRSRSSSPKISKPDISRPIYEEHAWENDEDAFTNPGDRDVEKGESTHRARTPEPPPQIALPSPLKKSRHHKYKPSQTTAAAADDRSLHEKRQSWIRQRASANSPFFSSSCGSSEKRPSIIGTMNGEGKESMSLEGSSDSGAQSRPVTTGAMPSEGSNFPGSLRRKRTGRRATARAYSETSSSGVRRWRSTALPPGEHGPLAGRAPSESPRSSMVLSGLSESLYTDTEESVGSAASNNPQSATVLGGLDVADKTVHVNSPKSEVGHAKRDANRESVDSHIQQRPVTFNPVVASPFSTRSLEGRKRSSPSLSLSPLRSHPPLRHHRSTSNVSPTLETAPSIPPPTGKENSPFPIPTYRPRTPSPTRAGRTSRPSSPLKSILSSPFKRMSTTSPSKRPTSSSSPIRRPLSSRRSGNAAAHRPLSTASSTSALSHDDLAILGVNLRRSPRKDKNNSSSRPKHSTLPVRVPHTTAGAQDPTAATTTMTSPTRLTATATPTALTLAALSGGSSSAPRHDSSPTPSLADLHAAAAIRRSAHAVQARRASASRARLSVAVREQLRAGMGGSIVNRGRHSSGSSVASALSSHKKDGGGSGGGATGLGAMERRALAEIGNVGKGAGTGTRTGGSGGVGASQGWSRGGGLVGKLEHADGRERSSWNGAGVGAASPVAATAGVHEQQKARDERDGSVGAFL
ncbi:hypothetical protein BC567DRAFT_246043 [Phyllosticta citribraziliensis]